MAWTTPGTATAGEVLTAAFWNANVRDNLVTTYNYGNVAYFRDEKPSGTAGGDFNTGAWRTRVLNTTVVNTISGCVLSSNQVTLTAGTYWIQAEAPALNVTEHRVLFYNVTDSSNAVLGTSGAYLAAVTVNAGGVARLEGPITIAGTKVFELRHRCSTTRATNGLGIPNGYGEVEVYANLWIWKVS